MIGRVILGLSGAIALFVLIMTGTTMRGLHSIAGTSVAEAYYQAMGLGFIGLGILAGGLMIGLALKD